jgi:hypothetical protein
LAISCSRSPVVGLAVDARRSGPARSAAPRPASCRRPRLARRPGWRRRLRPFEHDGQRLQGLAQAHVVGQAAAHAGGGEAHRPLVAFFLIGAQVSLQGFRQFRFDPPARRADGRWRCGNRHRPVVRCRRALRRARRRRSAAPCCRACRLRRRRQDRAVSVSASARQRCVDAVTHRDEAALVARGGEQCFELHDEAFVQPRPGRTPGTSRAPC